MIISLSYIDLMVAASLVMMLAGISFYMQLNLSQQILVSAARTAIQLLLIGLVLKTLFENVALSWVMLMALVMLTVAGWEVLSRQQRKLFFRQGFIIGGLSMFVSSFAITVFALLIIINNEPWYHPQYAIPLLGMMLGNTMNGVSLTMDRLISTAVSQRKIIEQRLMLGQSRREVIGDIRRESVRAGMIPIINGMASAGVVSLPGMMTGQILAGTAPVDAVKYQILIMFLIAVGTGGGVLVVSKLLISRLFDNRDRLHFDMLLVNEASRPS